MNWKFVEFIFAAVAIYLAIEAVLGLFELIDNYRLTIMK